MPNLIIIDCHDIGQHISPYGWKSVPTKNLERLANKGIRFENSFCTAPQCSPSRAGLYTGRYPHANGMLGLAHEPFNWCLKPDEQHLAELLRDAGYSTNLIGIQHVTASDHESIQKLGFDHVVTASTPKRVAEETSKFLSKPNQKPFFLKIGFEYPHRDSQGRFKQAPPYSESGVDVPPYLPQIPDAIDELAEFQGAIYQMDLAVGQILKSLTKSGLLNKTWVIFTTDHGIAMPMAKCTLYDPGIKTALIMYAESFGLQSGTVYDNLVSNIDLVPTILEMLNIDLPHNLQGHSFAYLLKNQPYTEREEVFIEKTFHTTYEPQRGIRTSRYKLIWNAEAGIVNVPGDIMRSPIFPHMIDTIVQERPHFELYDLDKDPHEQVNVAENLEYAQVFDKLRHRLNTWMIETGDPLLSGAIVSPFYQKGIQQLTSS